MFRNFKLIDHCLCLSFTLLMLSGVDLYASDIEIESNITNRSFDDEKNSKRKDKDKRVKKDIVAPDTLDINAKYIVVGGILTKVGDVDNNIDTVVVDSLFADSTSIGKLPISSLGDSIVSDSIPISDSIYQSFSKRELRSFNKSMRPPKYNRFFRDSIPISRVTAISVVVPGFSQLYNNQTWKIPVLYGTTGTALYFGIKQNKRYSRYKSEYDALLRSNATRNELTPVQTRMIQHNTYRQLLFAGALVSYAYFLGDGVVNYDGSMTSVKKATTLSTIFPGAGQFYNKSYWKAPIVMGAFTSMAFIIDFNSRGYNRFELALDLSTDGDDTTIDEFNGRYNKEFLTDRKKSYRRNRDLAIIATVGLYLLNIVDAHVDAHLQDYDISDDLAINLEPIFTNIYSHSRGSQNILGLNFNIKF